MCSLCGNCIHWWPDKCIIMGYKINHKEPADNCPYFVAGRKREITMLKGALNLKERNVLAINVVEMFMKESPGKIIRTKAIAKHLRTSSNHMSKVLQMMVSGKILSAKRGPGGGYSLNNINKLTLGDIINATNPVKGPPHTYNMKQCINSGLLSSIKDDIGELIGRALNLKVKDLDY